MTRKALGRGLSALIPEKKTEEIGERVIELSVDDISPSRFQPRMVFKKESLEELASSIKERGIIQPVIVAKKRDGYELIAGERRWRAAKSIGYKNIPALVKIVRDSDALEMALIENIQRENLNPVEEANAYERLMKEFALTQEGLARKLGKNRSTVANMLRLLKLPQQIQDDLSDGRLTMGHARALLALGSKEEQSRLRKEILNSGMNVREVESQVKAGKGGKKKETPRLDIHLVDVVQKLERTLGAKVVASPKVRGGSIQIHYHDVDDLNRIVEYILSR
ncbi:Chromosome (plasmid) partitioning protein ParB [hydrothermal vent metagenome]|uniref:Chromosome (Plasmid) partitioning protein ParB n=1 Tax=hydrothermal vent metagenome TaxID=652676 RepID=A0A3B1D408_9ZZZZ